MTGNDVRIEFRSKMRSLCPSQKKKGKLWVITKTALDSLLFPKGCEWKKQNIFSIKFLYVQFITTYRMRTFPILKLRVF